MGIVLGRIVIFTTILASLLYGPACRAADFPQLEPNILKRQALTDFAQSTEASLRQDWRTLEDGKSSNALRLSLAQEERDGTPHRVLRIDYQLPAAGAKPRLQHGVEAALRLGGLDASDYDHLSFLIKGVASAGFNHQVETGFRKPHDGSAGLEDVSRASVSDIGAQWRRVLIPLNQMIGITQWNALAEFSIGLLSHDARVSQGAYLIDDIALVKTGNPGPAASDQVLAPRKDAWEQVHGGGLAARQALKERLVGWPNRSLVEGKTLPKGEQAFLRRLAWDTWRGIDSLADREHGLPLDRVHFAPASVDVRDAFIGDYTSVTNIGFHLLAAVAAYELHFITHEQALARLKRTLASLERMETYRGFFYNYYNTTTLERTSNFVSFVDSAWLTAGLMTVRSAFPEIAGACTRLIEQGDYRFFYDDRWQLMSHGFYVNLNSRASYHYGSLYSEARLGSLIAIGKGEAPEAHWFAMARTFPNEYTWQSRRPLHRLEKNQHGFRWRGGYYQWRGYRYVPSWGGSLFEALMPTLLLDEQHYAPASLGANGRVHTEIQRRYALEDLGYPVWGMSPSSDPASDKYAEYGVRILGSLGYRPGAVTPHAAALALQTDPAQAAANLLRLAERFPAYGDFGFYDAVDPKTGQVAYKYLCLNQAMILVALANHLAHHAVQKHFAADPIARRTLPLIGFENFFD